MKATGAGSTTGAPPLAARAEGMGRWTAEDDRGGGGSDEGLCRPAGGGGAGACDLAPLGAGGALDRGDRDRAQVLGGDGAGAPAQGAQDAPADRGEALTWPIIPTATWCLTCAASSPRPTGNASRGISRTAPRA